MADQATNSSGKGGKLAQLSIFESKADEEAKKATSAQATGAGTGRSFVAAEGDRCEVCAKRVYIAEKLEADGRVMHKSCFRCAHCNGALKLGTYASLQGKYYCKPHFKQLFALKGNYAEGFGEKKPQDVWMRGKEGGDEPDAATVTDGTDTERQRREDAERERQRIEAQEKDRLMRAAREREREQLQNQQKRDEEAARQKRQEWEKRERERLEREEKDQQEKRKRESEAREREASAAAAAARQQQQQQQKQQQQLQAKDQGQDVAKRNAEKERELQRREREVAGKERELKEKERDLDRRQAQQQQQQQKPQHGGGGTGKKELELERKVQELQEALAAKDRQLQKLQAGKPAAATTAPPAALPRGRGQWGWYAFAAAPYVVCSLWLAFLWH